MSDASIEDAVNSIKRIEGFLLRHSSDTLTAKALENLQQTIHHDCNVLLSRYDQEYADKVKAVSLQRDLAAMEQKCLDLEGRLSAAELARDDATTKLEHLQSAFNVAELARDDATAKLEHLQLTFNANIAQMKAQCDAKNLQYENNCNDQLERHKRERDDDLRRHRLTFTIGLAHARSNYDRLLNSAIEHKDEELRAHKRSFEEAFGSRVEEAARLVRRTDAQASDRHSQLIKDLSERIDGQFSVLSSRFDAMANDMTSVRANTGSILQTQSSLSDAVTSMCNESQRVSMSVKANMCQLTELVEGLGVTLVDVKNSVSRVPSAAMQMQAAINNVPNVLETSIQDGTKSLVSMLSAVLEHVQSISGLSPAMQSVEKFMVTLKPLPKLSSKIVRSLDVVVAGQSALERHLHLFRTDGHDIVEAMKGCQEVLGHIRTEMGSFATSHTYELGNLLLQFDSGNDEVVAQMQSIATSYDAALNAVCVSIDSLIADQVASFRDLRARMNGIAEDVQSVNGNAVLCSQQVTACHELVRSQFDQWSVRLPRIISYFGRLVALQTRLDLTTAASLITDSLRTRMQDASSNMSSAIDDIVPRVTQSVTDVMVQPLSRLPTSEEVADLVAPVSRSVNSLLSAEETRQLLGSLPTSTEMRDLVAPIVSKTNSLLSSEDARKLVGGLPTSEELANVVAQRPITAEANKLLGSFRDQMCDGFSNIAAEISKRDSRALSRAAVASQPSTSTGDQSGIIRFGRLENRFWNPAGSNIVQHLTMTIPIIYTRNVTWRDAEHLVLLILRKSSLPNFDELIRDGASSKLYCLESLITLGSPIRACAGRDGGCRNHPERECVLLKVVRDTNPGQHVGFGLEKRVS